MKLPSAFMTKLGFAAVGRRRGLLREAPGGRLHFAKGMEPMKILAIESSCDETAVAIVEDGRKVLTDCIASQVALHREYGGVVPEIASRKHIEAISDWPSRPWPTPA